MALRSHRISLLSTRALRKVLAHVQCGWPGNHQSRTHSRSQVDTWLRLVDLHLRSLSARLRLATQNAPFGAGRIRPTLRSARGTWASAPAAPACGSSCFPISGAAPRSETSTWTASAGTRLWLRQRAASYLDRFGPHCPSASEPPTDEQPSMSVPLSCEWPHVCDQYCH